MHEGDGRAAADAGQDASARRVSIPDDRSSARAGE
jgi:hypothetical protein